MRMPFTARLLKWIVKFFTIPPKSANGTDAETMLRRC
jgi:hypothetical protein